MTEITDVRRIRGRVFYDANCPRCCQLARRVSAVLHRRGFELVPFQTAAPTQPRAPFAFDLEAEMRVLTHHGRTHGGAEAETLLVMAGWLHFAILMASALTPRVLDWGTNLASLPPLLRRLFWVYGGFIVLVIYGAAVFLAKQ